MYFIKFPYLSKTPKRIFCLLIVFKTFDDKVLFEVESDFHDIKVVENEIGKFLHYCEILHTPVLILTSFFFDLVFFPLLVWRIYIHS